jgi:plastocyanin
MPCSTFIRLRRLLPVTFVGLLVLTAACGGGEPPEPVVSEPPPPPLTVADGAARVTGTAPAASGVVVSIVLLEPHAEIDVPMSEEMPVMDQYGRQFVPNFLLVRAGQTINFTNSEDDLHTVHLKDSDGESLINVATMMGSSYQFLVERAGDYSVVCNTHTEMFADILAFDTPYFAQADQDGSFTLADVIPGSYTATVIHGGERTEREVEIVVGINELDLTGV